MPEYLTQGGAFALLAWVIYMLVSKINPALENNTAATRELVTVVKLMVEMIKQEKQKKEEAA